MSAVPTTRSRTAGGWRRWLSNPWLFALPAVAIYGLFLVYPAAQSLWLSFTDWDGLSPTREFVGLSNYQQMLEDPTALLAARNNVLWAIVTISAPVVLGLTLAVVLNGAVWAKPFLRTIFYTPAVLPLVAIGAIWGWMYDPGTGTINEVLRLIGLESLAQPWLGQDSTALWATMVPAVWVRTGFPMLLYLAALQTISKDLYESAKIDGAGVWQQFRYVTMPGLRAAHGVVIALSVIESFKVFDLIYTMTYGGPGRSTQVLGTWMYFNVFQYYNAGYGTAIAVVISLVAVAVGIPYIRSQTREER